MKTSSGLVVLGLVFASVIWTHGLQAEDAKGPANGALERTRATVQMLDDLYKSAVVSITKNYVEEQGNVPAAAVAKDVFEAMHKKGWHSARLVDVTGRPKNKANVAKSDFEKKAVAAIRDGKGLLEEVGDKDGQKVLRVATVVPVVMQQCAICHGRGHKGFLGTIVYEVPIK